MHRSSGLDWNAIESEVQRQTTTLAIERGSSSSYAAGAAAFSRASNPFLNASDALGVSVDTNAAVYLPPPPGVYDPSAGQFSSTADSSSVAALSREVMELRAIINQQNKKIGVMERMFDSYNDILESSSATQISTNDKLTQIESELRSNGKIFANASRERAELSYSLQNIDNKFGTLDQYVRSLVTDYTTKESFQKLVVATVEQIDRLRGTLESNRIKGNQSWNFTEAFVRALHGFRTDSGGSDGGGAKLDLLLQSLESSDDVGINARSLNEAFKAAIKAIVDDGLSQVADNISHSFRPVVEELQRSQESNISLTHNKCVNICNRIAGKVERFAEVVTRVESTVDNIQKRQHINDNESKSLRDTVNNAERSVYALKDTIYSQQTLLDVIQSTNQQVRQLQSAELMSFRDGMSELQKSMLAAEKAHCSIKVESSNLHRELSQDIESNRLLISEFQTKLLERREETAVRNAMEDRIAGFEESFISRQKELVDYLNAKIEDACLSAALDKRASSSSSSGLGDADSDIKKEIIVIHNALAKVTDDHDVLSSTVGQMTNRLSSLGDSDRQLQSQLDSMLESLARLKLEVDNITRIHIPKLGDDLGEKNESLHGACKRLQKAMDTLQDELVGLHDSVDKAKEKLVAHDIAIEEVEGEVLQIYENESRMRAKVEAVETALAAAGTQVLRSKEPTLLSSLPTFNMTPPSSMDMQAYQATAAKRDIHDDSSDEKGKALDSAKNAFDNFDLDDDDKEGTQERKDKVLPATAAVPQSVVELGASSIARAAAGAEPTPSEQLQLHLKFRVVEEQRRAAANAAKKAALSSSAASSPVRPVLLSGSLLSRGPRADSSNPKHSTSLAQSALAMKKTRGDSTNPIPKPYPDPTLAAMTPPASPASATESAVQRTQSLGLASVEKSKGKGDTTQCPHCLRRYPKTDITSHTKSCDLRTEYCKFGCGSRIRFLKMAQHLESCINKTITNELEP